MALDFAKVFELGTGNPKHAASRAVKRLRDNDCSIEDHTVGGSGPLENFVKIADLKHYYKLH